MGDNIDDDNTSLDHEPGQCVWRSTVDPRTKYMLRSSIAVASVEGFLSERRHGMDVPLVEKAQDYRTHRRNRLPP